jgi:hypothetical protein
MPQTPRAFGKAECPCDGFSLNLEFFSVYPKVGGAFNSAVEGQAVTGHPIRFAFRTRKPLRDLAKHIEVFVEGLAPVQGYIDEVTDVETEAVNETLTPGGQFIITGHKLKIAGTDASVGIYFAPQSGGGQPVKVTGRLAENTASKLIGIIPALADGQYKVRVVTQFTGSGSLLKEPRTIESAHALTVGSAPAPQSGKD